MIEEIYDYLDGVMHTYTPAQLELTYRRSRFSHTDEIIVSGDFKLAHGDKAGHKARPTLRAPHRARISISTHALTWSATAEIQR